MKLNIRNIVRLLFLGAILFLWYIGRIDMWGPLVLGGLLLTPFWGRVYCGWVCPASTSIDILKPLFPKTPLAKYKPFLLLKKVNALFFLLFLAYLIYSIKNNYGLPLFILIIPVGLILTLLFGETAAHRNCFFGIIYSWLGRISRRTYFVTKENCSSCKQCIAVCPNKCLTLDVTDKKHCLVCGKCASACQGNNIRYGIRLDYKPGTESNSNNVKG